jgi:hypothetical protein
MKLKGKKELNKSISAILKPFGIRKAKLSKEYTYSFATEKVTFKITENEIEDKMFKDFVEDRFGYEVERPFIFSLLHEVGHHKANFEIEGAILDFCLSEKKRIEQEMENAETEEEVVKLSFQYFNLPDEIMATQWAVNFAMSNPQAVVEMEEQAETALRKFYKKNRVVNL